MSKRVKHNHPINDKNIRVASCKACPPDPGVIKMSKRIFIGVCILSCLVAYKIGFQLGIEDEKKYAGKLISYMVAHPIPRAK